MLSSHDPLSMIFYGLITGLVFGFLLHKAGVTRYQVILGQFLFKDFTVLKVMLTAIVTGAIGVYGMRNLGMEFNMHIKEAVLGANIVGGLIFGVGMSLLGYCPGTGVAAIGGGSRHAIPGVLGMIAGAALYAETFPWLQGNVLNWANLGKKTLAEPTGLSTWSLIAILALIALVLFLVIERWEKRQGRGPSGQ